MDMEKGERKPHPPADFDCLGAGIRGVVSQIADIDPRVVRDDIRMPHFKAPCMKSFLVTVEDAGGVHHLLLNRSHLEETLRRGDATVRTEFYSVGPSNDLSLMAARFSYPFSASGEARYSEHLRNLAVMRDELVRMGAMRYAHGGDRTSERFTREQRENLSSQLAQLTGKEVKTMMNWLTFIDKLSVETLDKLVALDCKRSVYEAIQPGKRLFIKRLGRNLPEEEKVEAVSEKVLELAEKHLRETPEREARPRTRHSTGNGLTHRADAPAAGNDTDPACVEDGEGNTPQKADRREQEGSEQQERSDGESQLAESLEVLDRGLETKVGKFLEEVHRAPRDRVGLEVREKLLEHLEYAVMEAKITLGELFFLTDAPIPSQWAPDQAEDGSW